MRNSSVRVAFALAACVASTACGGGGGTATPVAGIEQSGAAERPNGDATIRNFSGEYAGTVKDSYYERGAITASFAQYHTAVGGSLTQVEGSGSRTETKFASFEVTNGTTLTGTAAGTFGSGGTSICVFAIGGTYNAATHRLKGSYQGVNGCSESGTFTMKQKCYYARHGTSPEVGGLKMC
jgi:hypothetical protein